MAELVTTGTVAEAIGLPQWQARRLIDDLGLGQRVGQYRTVRRSELPRIARAARQRGYLKEQASQEAQA
jgi:hypothetical protein